MSQKKCSMSCRKSAAVYGSSRGVDEKGGRDPYNRDRRCQRSYRKVADNGYPFVFPLTQQHCDNIS